MNVQVDRYFARFELDMSFSMCVCEGDGCYIVNALTATFNTQSTRYLSLAGELWIIFSEQFVF